MARYQPDGLMVYGASRDKESSINLFSVEAFDQFGSQFVPNPFA
jgi:hypothetical protein